MKQKQGIPPLKPILGAVLNAYEYKGVDFLEIFNTIHSELPDLPGEYTERSSVKS